MRFMSYLGGLIRESIYAEQTSKNNTYVMKFFANLGKCTSVLLKNVIMNPSE